MPREAIPLVVVYVAFVVLVALPLASGMSSKSSLPEAVHPLNRRVDLYGPEIFRPVTGFLRGHFLVAAVVYVVFVVLVALLLPRARARKARCRRPSPRRNTLAAEVQRSITEAASVWSPGALARRRASASRMPGRPIPPQKEGYDPSRRRFFGALRASYAVIFL